MGDKIFAGIVTYNPEIERLRENISAVISQVDALVIVDNGSKNNEQIKNALSDYEGVAFLSNDNNMGIAAALNRIFTYASERRGGYILTLDQDSVVYPDIVEEYCKLIGIKGAASFTSLRTERDFCPKQITGTELYTEVDKCITSGNLVEIAAWKKIGGFNEKLFIDMVDTEFCYRLRRAGYKIIQLNKVEITHELGAAFTVKFGGRERTVLNHSAFRRYYIFRNTVYLLRKYPESRKNYSYKGLFTTFCAAFLYESDKWHKASSSLKGFFDGFRFE